MTYAFLDFELDEQRQELRRTGQLVAIRRRPLELLGYLIRNRHRVVSRAEILDSLWEGVSVSDYALSSAIRDLRRALEPISDDRPLLRTHNGVGYRFVAPVSERSDEAAAADWIYGLESIAESLPDASRDLLRDLPEGWLDGLAQRVSELVAREVLRLMRQPGQSAPIRARGQGRNGTAGEGARPCLRRV